MKLDPNQQNNNTQPRTSFKVFNRWDVVSNGWYLALDSKELKDEQAKGVDVSGQHLVVYRGKSGKIYALDGFCSHMGVDLGIGKVEEDNIRCFFHHWKFNGRGECVDIPCLKGQSKKIKSQHYATQEKYGKIWIYPGENPAYSVLDIPELKDSDVSFSSGKPYKRSCHYHITMINGIDPQHLSTVHDIHMDMSVNIDASEKDTIDIQLKGETPRKKISERMIRFFLGSNYAYSMKYQGGCLAALSVMKGVKLFGKWDVIPTLHMLFAYQSHRENETYVQPIYVTKKRNIFVDKLLLFITKMAFFSLQGEDGEVYENIRFNTSNLLPIDAPVAKYIQHINSLTPSIWSRFKIDKDQKKVDSSEPELTV